MAKRKTNGKASCYVASCENDAEIGDLCKNCYNGMYYWKDRTPTAVVKRAKQLQVLSDRMDLLGSNRR